MGKDRDDVSKMVDMLRSGATMLAETCPVCRMPLFKLKSGDVYCATCEKRVLIVKGGEEGEVKVLQLSTIMELDRTIFSKLTELNELIKHESDAERLYELTKYLVAWLEALDRVRHIRKELEETKPQ